MKKGFATSAILYTLLLLFMVVMVGILNNLQNKKTILDALKTDTILALEENNCNLDIYSGTTKIKPGKTTQILNTEGKYLPSDITIEPISPLIITYNLGSNSGDFLRQQTRFQPGQYAQIYSYYKITSAEKAADWMTDVCQEIYFSTDMDVNDGNMEINKEYPINQNFVNYISGSKGCFYKFQITYYN